MSDKELMQQALDALIVYDGTNGESKRKRVLAALRERLTQPEQEPFCYYDGRNIVGKEYAHHCDVFALYAEPALCRSRSAIEETEKQEPVAWMWADGTITTDPDRADGTWTPLYIAPRQWQGLTDEDKAELDDKYGDDILAHLNAIEAKLKEKNNA